MDDILLLGPLSCIGTHVVGPLPDWEGLGKASLAWEWHFLDLPRTCLGVLQNRPCFPDGPIYAEKTRVLG